MFFGEYEHTIDDKNRLTLPAKYRDALAGGVVLTRGLDECLDVYARGEWDALVEQRLAPLDPFSKEARELKRFFFAAAADAELEDYLHLALLNRGIFAAPRGMFNISTPMTEAHVDRAIAAVRDALTEVLSDER